MVGLNIEGRKDSEMIVGCASRGLNIDEGIISCNSFCSAQFSFALSTKINYSLAIPPKYCTPTIVFDIVRDGVKLFG